MTERIAYIADTVLQRVPWSLLSPARGAILSSLAIVAVLVVDAAWAQPELEKLDRQIRQRSQPTDGSADSPNQALPQPADVQGTAVDEVHAHDPAYLGLIADDQNDRGRGVRIMLVRPGSPAERSGLRRQDLITAITGIRVRHMSDLSDALDTFSAGQAAVFDILRDGKKQTVKVTFGRRPADARLQPASPQPGSLEFGRSPATGSQRAGTPSASAQGESEILPPPPGELLPEPPEQTGGPLLQPRATVELPSPQPPTPLLPPPTVKPPSDESRRIEQLERRIEELERRVTELERALAEASKSRQ